MLFKSLTSILALTASVYADVEFTKPAAGSAQKGGGALSIAWKESGSGPAITTFQSYQLFLMAGGNTAAEMVQLAAVNTDGQFASGSQAQIPVSIGLGGSTKNAYFIKILCTGKTGGTYINYSDRFTLSGMTGSWPAGEVSTAIAGLGSSTSGPPAEDNLSSTNPAAGAVGDAEFTVSFGMQTGLTRYAPMQGVPPTKISAKNPTPLFPSSAVQIAKTALPPPSIVTTMTQTQTFSVNSIENTIAAQSQPDDDMAKYLRRWAD